jgi:hypothetical protein
MKIEALSLGILALTACSPTPRGEWPPSETGFQCVNGETEENARLLADERARLDLIGSALNVDLMEISEEYGRRALAAGCSHYDLLEAQEEMMRRENPDLEDTI